MNSKKRKQDEKSIVYKTSLSSCSIIDGWIERKEANELLSKCGNLKLDIHPKCIVYGKECTMKRSIGFYSDLSKGYSYANQTSSSSPLEEWMSDLIRKIRLVPKERHATLPQDKSRSSSLCAPILSVPSL